MSFNRSLRGLSGKIVTACLFLALASGATAQPAGPNGNLPAPEGEVFDRLRNDDFDVVSAKPTAGGTMGAMKLELVFRRDGFRMHAKWKAAPSKGDGWNNSPRREIGAYAIQRLFLDSEDQVVPPTVTRCIPLDTYRAVEEKPRPNLDGARCVYGMLAAWLENATEPTKVLDRERFSTDRRYAFHLANVNVLTYLIAHRDLGRANFLISTDPANPQLFTVDNGIAFGGVLYNFFATHLDEMRVGGVPRHSIDRLRRVTSADLVNLGVLQQLELDEAGILRQVTPSANLDPQDGTRLTPGRIQFGLRAKEIDGVAQRLHGLLRDVDAGRLVLF